MSRALVLSGGAFRGAVQVPVIEYLKRRYKYDAIYGVSVGAINGVMFAQNDLETLRYIWDSVDGKEDFLSSRWYWPFRGLYSMEPIRKKLEHHVKLSYIKIPFYAGMVSFTDGEYRNLYSGKMKKNKELWDAIQASACMAGIMIPNYIDIDGEKHLGADGGFRNIIPIPEDGCYKNLDVVTCTPLDRMKMKSEFKKIDIFSILSRTIDIFEDEIFDKDFIELQKCKKTKIRVFSPNEYPGDSLDASKETIRFRYKLGEEAIKNPLILGD